MLLVDHIKRLVKSDYKYLDVLCNGLSIDSRDKKSTLDIVFGIGEDLTDIAIGMDEMSEDEIWKWARTEDGIKHVKIAIKDDLCHDCESVAEMMTQGLFCKNWYSIGDEYNKLELELSGIPNKKYLVKCKIADVIG